MHGQTTLSFEIILYVFLRFDVNTAATIFTALVWLFTTCRRGTWAKVSEEPAASVYVCLLMIHAANPLKGWPFSTILYSAILYSTILYSAILYSTILYSAILYSAILYSAILYSTILYSTILYSTILYSAILYSTILYSTILYSAIFQETKIFSSFFWKNFLILLPVKCGTRSEAPNVNRDCGNDLPAQG